MGAHRLVAVAFALLVVLAGCSAPLPLGQEETPTPDEDERDPETPTRTPTPTSTPTATPAGTPTLEDDVDVDGGELAVSENLLFARVERLLGEDVRSGTVNLRDLEGAKGSNATFTPIYDVLGVGEVQLNRSRPAGVTDQSGTVYFDPRNAEPWLVERRLVHEFVHVVQFRAQWVGGPSDYDVELTRDFVMAWRSVAEGGAVYASDAYIRKYDVAGPLQSEMLAQDYRAGSPDGNRMVLAPYHFGFRYVRAQIDSPHELASVYERVPRTTEQVLHNETSLSEPPMELHVDTDTGTTFDQAAENRMGEMFVRVVLRSELDRERAARAAAGWGTDAWLTFTDDEERRWGLAWVTRWDTQSDADEFAAALRKYVDRRADDTVGEFRVVRLSDGTVVLLAGDDDFLDAVSVDGGGDEVSVTVDAAGTATMLAASGTHPATLAADPARPTTRAAVSR